MANRKINWDKIANKNSIPKIAIREAVEKAGNCNQLAVLLEKSNAQISKWVHERCQRGKDLMRADSAMQVEKAIKIKGIAERLCPSIKKIKNF